MGQVYLSTGHGQIYHSTGHGIGVSQYRSQHRCISVHVMLKVCHNTGHERDMVIANKMFALSFPVIYPSAYFVKLKEE